MGCMEGKSRVSPCRNPRRSRGQGAYLAELTSSRRGTPGSCARFRAMVKPSRTRSAAAALLAALTMLLLAVPAAFAENGVGLAGPTTDKTVTFFCFGVIGFFAVLVIVLSLLQGRLEKRKEMRKHTLDRLG
jgi:hypothetical protein